jgi:hypothetical protein
MHLRSISSQLPTLHTHPHGTASFISTLHQPYMPNELTHNDLSNNFPDPFSLSIAYNILIPTVLLLRDEPTTGYIPVPVASPYSMTANTLVACLESYINPALPIGTAINSDDNVPALHLLPSTTLSKLKTSGRRESRI